MNLRSSLLLVALWGSVLPAGAQTIHVDPKPLPPVTTKTISPDLVRGLCARAVRAEETEQRVIRVNDVSLLPTKNEHVAACTVSATLIEGDGARTHVGAISTTDVRYYGSLDLDTGKVQLTRIDENAAKEAALLALARAFIDIKPATMDRGRISYAAVIGNKKCTVDVSNDTPPGNMRWEVTKMDCKR